VNYGSRNYSDLRRTDIAVYNFRGYTVLKFNKENKQLEIGKHADMCCFISTDLLAMAQFLEQCYLYTGGTIADVEHVEVD
jgi:hypothetical protein